MSLLVGGVLLGVSVPTIAAAIVSREAQPASSNQRETAARADGVSLAELKAGTQPPRLDRSAMRLTFEDEFNSLDLKRWATTPIVNEADGNGSSLPGNTERQWYINDRYAPTAGVRPWKLDNGELVITASRTPAAIRPLLGYDPKKNPEVPATFKLGSYEYVSGRLATHRSFNQLYGYFEIEAKLPAGKGLWPAFWLLPQDMSWPPEIDVIEVLGHEPRKIYQTIHWNEPATPQGQHKSAHVLTEAFDASADYHRYGVHWTKEFVAFYVDGRETKRFPTPAHMHRPMYLIVNLAVGGSWPGDPDRSTRFPAELRVRSVRAWR